MPEKEPYRKDWMTDDQYECHRMLADIVGGFHHIYNKVKPWADGIETSINGQWSTFDFNLLTRAVVLAHDRTIRFGVESSGRGLFRIVMHKRRTREGRMSERHPTIEDAIQTLRGSL